MSRDEVAPVGGDEQASVLRPRFRPALEHRSERARIPRDIEAEIVDEQRKGAIDGRDRIEQRGQAIEPRADQLDQRDIAAGRLHRRDGAFHHRRFAGAARAPQQHVLRGMAGGEPIEIGEQRRLLLIDPVEHIERQRRELPRRR